MLDTTEPVEVIIDEQRHRYSIKSAQLSAGTNTRSYIWEIPPSSFPIPFYPFIPESNGHYLYELTVALDTQAPQWRITISSDDDAAQTIREMKPAFMGLCRQGFDSLAKFVHKLKQLAESLQTDYGFISVSLRQEGEKNEVLYTSPPIAAAASGTSSGAEVIPAVSPVTPMRDVSERASCPEITPDSKRCLIM